MSYYQPISDAELTAAEESCKYLFDPSVYVSPGGFTMCIDNRNSLWYSEFKISKTLAGVQAFIDNDLTYIGAVHRVVADSSNNGLYVIMNGGNGLEYRRIAFTSVQKMQNTTMSQYDAQNSYFTSVGDNYIDTSTGIHFPIDGPFVWPMDNHGVGYNFLQWYSDGRYPVEGCLVTDTYDTAIKFCSPVNAHDAGWGENDYWYMSWPGKYISVVADPDASKNGLYFVGGNTYPEMRLIKLAFDQNNPTVSDTITKDEAIAEYYEIFPWLKQYHNTRQTWRHEPRWDASLGGYRIGTLTMEWAPMEMYTVFRSFEAMQVWHSGHYQYPYPYANASDLESSDLRNLNVYPGKIVSVIDDPDPNKNGLYMVAGTLTPSLIHADTDPYYFSDIYFMKMTNA